MIDDESQNLYTIESLIDSLETNTIDINFMDDVGQTLLNWAAAFGTPEIIEYLCAKGADVNRGHYLMIQLIMNQLTI
jgi:ankyrin repeat protein